MVRFLDLKRINDSFQPALSQAASRVIESGWYLKGRETQCFEEEFARYIGSAHAVGCANGLDALRLTFEALVETGKLKKGDEVLVPANTFIASFLAISGAGLKPVPVDVTVPSLEINLKEAQRFCRPHTKALLLVHLYGRNNYTKEMEAFVGRNGLLLVEDNAQAHGCITTDGRRTGSIGVAGCHSFYPGKNLGALGDGGAVTTDDEELASVVRALGNYGSTRKYVSPYKGCNSRLDELQAAMLRVKLPLLDDYNYRRQAVAEQYYRELSLLEEPTLWLPSRLNPGENVFHLFPIFTSRRDEFQSWLKEKGIETIVHYPIPPHLQECYQGEFQEFSLPVAEELAQTELSLPISPLQTEAETTEVLEAVKSFFN